MEVSYFLFVTSGTGARQVVPVADRPITVGRLPTSTILVDEAPISRQHCVVIPTGAGLTILDQGSTNGTFVNGVRVQPARLQHNDEIKIGSTVIRVEAERHSPDALARETPPNSTPMPTLSPPLQPDKQLDFIAGITSRLLQTSEAAIVHEVVLGTLLASFPVQRAMILRQKSWDDPMRVKAIDFRHAEEVSLPAEVLNRKLIKLVMTTGQAEVSLPDDEGQASRYIWDAAICAPLHSKGRQVGVLYADTSRPASFLKRRETLSTFSVLANLVSLATDLSPPGRSATSRRDTDRSISEAQIKGRDVPGERTASQTRRLEEERIQLTERVNQMEHLERARTSLHRGLVHDIKNLVGALNSNHTFLRTAISAGTDQMEAMDDAVEISKRIVAMAEDVLSLSRMEDGSFPLAIQEVNVVQMLNRALRRHATHARQQEVSLALGPINEGLEAIVDPTVVDRMLDNLLSNALRHAGEGGWTILSAELFNDGAEITVADSGPSVPPDERDTIFTEWYSSEATKSRHHGIGLYFCRIAAEAHGGSVRIEGAPGDNRVVIGLPAATEDMLEVTTDVSKVPPRSLEKPQ